METVELVGEQPLVIINKAELKLWIGDSLDEEIDEKKLEKLADAFMDYILIDVPDWFNENFNSFLSNKWDELDAD